MKSLGFLIVCAFIMAGCARTTSPASAGAVVAVYGREIKDRPWGIASLSVVSCREKPEHKAELGTQVLMGQPVRLLSDAGHWVLAESADGYRAWLEATAVARTDDEGLAAWTNAPRLIVTAMEEMVRATPQPESEPVSDVVIGNLLRRLGEENGWTAVGLPDGRAGYLPSSAVQDYSQWAAARQPTPAAVEQTARRFLGRPYLWGGTSPKGLDCSGYTGLVFWLNGLQLPRNASQQAKTGFPVAVDPDLRELKPGDLVFFGRKATANSPERVTHVGIYLGNKLFIHSAGRVQVSSLDASSGIRDERRLGRVLHVRRVLPDLPQTQ